MIVRSLQILIDVQQNKDNKQIMKFISVSFPCSIDPKKNYLQVVFPWKNIFYQMISSPFKVILIVLALLSIWVSSQQTTKPQTLLCPQQCGYYFNNNQSVFASNALAARNLSKEVVRSDNFSDFIKSFNNYPASFKRDHLYSMFAYRQIKNFGKLLQKTYSTEIFKDYLTRSFPQHCDQFDSSRNYGEGSIAFYGMFNQISLPQDINEIDSTGLFVPITRIPLISRPYNYPEDYIIVTISGSPIDQQFQCFYNQILADYSEFFPPSPPPSPPPNPLPIITQQPHGNMDSGPVHLQYLNAIIKDQDVMGLANVLLYSKFGDLAIETYMSCLNQIYADC